MQMKMKFIFNINEILRSRPVAPPAPLSPRANFRPALACAALALSVASMGSQIALAQLSQTLAVKASPPPADTQSASQSQPPDAPRASDPSDPPATDDAPAMFPRFKDTRFWLSGQANFIFQTHPSFPALYSGTHSLSPNYQKATSRVLTLYSGVRLTNTLELIGDLEEAGGSALSLGFGLAGNTDLDIVRNPLLSKAPYLARGEIHKVLALSKDK